MDYFKWHDTYNINLQVIDEQHKKLVEMLNSLHEAVVQKKKERDKNLEDILEGLSDYIFIHFKTEEDFMKKYNDPGFDSHKKEHEGFVKDFIKTERDYNGGVKDLDAKIMDYLKDWLIKHILATDKKMGLFLHDSGVR